MDQLKRERAALRRALTNWKKDPIGGGMTALALEDKKERLFVLDSSISELLEKDESLSEQYLAEEYDAVEKYRELYFELKASREQETKPTLRKINLPTLEWTKFDGDIQNWIRFYSQFSKIHEDDNITSEDKFLYLLQATTGKALKLVQSYPPTGENYPKAFDALHKRFARDELLIDHYVRNLINLVTAKNEITLSNLYDQLHANVCNLETLGLTKDNYSCIILPLLESSLPVDLQRSWEKARKMKDNRNALGASSTSLDLVNLVGIEELMEFLRIEVEADEKIKAVNRFSFDKDEVERDGDKFVTACELINDGKLQTCIFCGNSHSSHDCVSAQKLSLEDRKKIISKKAACFKCLELKHLAKDCKVFIRCILCSKAHYVLLCPLASDKKQNATDSCFTSPALEECHLQTLQVILRNNFGEKRRIRCILDSGSSFSYVTNSLAKELKLERVGKTRLIHCLFGGAESGNVEHNKYVAQVENVFNKYVCDFQVLGQDKICKHIKGLKNKEVLKLLKEKNIELSDTGRESSIEMLIGADNLATILTGKIECISENLTAIHTKLGWTVLGQTKKVNNYKSQCLLNNVKQFWDLEMFGLSESQSDVNITDNFKD